MQAQITPTEKAIAGDYVTTIRASARGESASATFRVTVATSTLWGIAGVGIIGIALLVMVGAVARFGRPMNTDTVIEAKGLTKTYGDAVAVDHVRPRRAAARRRP